MGFTFIVPAYNVERYLQKCLDSILSQVDVDKLSYEIIVVNDGSTDTTLSIANKVETENENVQVVSQPNQGLSVARNVGLDLAKGDYVWFVDSDDWISCESLHRIWGRIVRTKPDVLLIRAANSINGKLIERGAPYENIDKIYTGKEILLRRIWQTCAPFYIFRKDFLIDNNLRFYTGIFHEDNEFTPRMLYRADKVALLNDVLYFVFQNPNSITRTINHKKSFDLLKVADSLIDFCNREVQEKDVRICLMQFISMNINNALHSAMLMHKDLAKNFEKEMRKRPQYASYLIQSRIKKYVVEGFLFKLSTHYLANYRFLQNFNLK